MIGDLYEIEAVVRGKPPDERQRVSQEKGKQLFCGDGRIEISNVLAVNALRWVALGRRNFMFSGSESGGERAAAIYSLIGSCKLNDLNPHTYLEYVLTPIADHQANRIDELLPWNVAKHLTGSAPVPL